MLRKSFKSVDKKYELIASDVPGLFRVRALRDFGTVKAGDVGGYVAGARNLSYEGDVWVGGNAHVFGNARVTRNAPVRKSSSLLIARAEKSPPSRKSVSRLIATRRSIITVTPSAGGSSNVTAPPAVGAGQ